MLHYYFTLQAPLTYAMKSNLANIQECLLVKFAIQL